MAHRRAWYFLLVLGAGSVLLCACAGAGSWLANSPRAVVKRFWTALLRNQQDAMLDCIEPALRSQADPYACIGLPAADWGAMVLDMLRRHAKGTILDLNGLKFEELDNDGAVAHVRVSGRLRVAGFGLVREFSVTHTSVRVQGQWYLSSAR